MKILVIHNKYQQAGGEDTVVNAETELLSSFGHDVHLWSVDNNNLPTGFQGKIKTALSASYSETSRITAQNKLRSFRPDIAHVHNFFPQISPSVYDACINENIPIIQTLHNYRLICPGALLMRDGKICELCVTGSPYQAARYGCYRESKAGSLAVAHMVAQHRKKQTWNHKIDRFIALTEFAKSKFVQAGFPEHKIAVKPNFIKQQSSEDIIDKPNTPYALFVGRLSEEKGIKTLVKAWRNLNGCCTLKVAGDGPLLHLLNNVDHIKNLGYQDSKAVSQLMQQAAFLIIPSEWYEGFPMVLVEAFSHGLPAIASKLGSLAEIVTDGKTGLLFEPGNPNELADKVRQLINNIDECKRMGINAKSIYLSCYTPEQNIKKLLTIYQQAIEAKKEKNS
jgi:glycosyltransferase involved in cell wall biosynthesis